MPFVDAVREIRASVKTDLKNDVIRTLQRPTQKMQDEDAYI